MKIEYPPGATPLTDDDLKGLIPTGVSTRAQLDEFEARNIVMAEGWAPGSAFLRSALTTEGALNQLHERMFGETWRWAGRFRCVETNIGLEPWQISEALGGLHGDVTLWIEQQTFAWPEIAVRFHHRLVEIHPYRNGNGRHARFAADLLLLFNGQPRLSWGGVHLGKESARRDEYIAALKEADRGGPCARLLRFCTKA